MGDLGLGRDVRLRFERSWVWRFRAWERRWVEDLRDEVREWMVEMR